MGWARRVVATASVLTWGGVVRTRGQDLESKVRPNLVLWLDATRGVEVSEATKTVVGWKDLSGGGYAFAPLSAAQHRAASARWKVAVVRQRKRGTVEQAPPASEEGLLGFEGPRLKGDAVAFPAPLIANNLQLRDGLTAYFVLTPRWLNDGDQAIGQRFFGHYPYGQFRFHDRRLAFKSEEGDHVHSEDLVDGDTIIAAYRFHGDVAMSVNGQPFEQSHGTRRLRGKPPVFSSAGYVTLGGCPPHHSFVGTISEVMIFGIPLGDDEARHVADVLAERHGLRLSSRRKSDASSGSRTRNALPQSHDPSYVPIDISQTPEIPGVAQLVDASGRDDSAPSTARLGARDRVSAYKKLKDSHQHPPEPAVNAATSPSSDATLLLQQLRETQERLAQIQASFSAGGLAVPAQNPPPQAPGRPVLQGGGPPPQAMPPAQATPGGAQNMCLGGDAFQKESTSKWTPPALAKLEDIQKWTAAKEASDAAIRAFPRGGKELRDFVHKQVTALRLLRHNLFCAIATPPAAAGRRV